MLKKTVIFQEYNNVIVKEVDELFSFSILYYDKSSLADIIPQSKYIVVAASRGLKRISLERVNGKDQLLITNGDEMYGINSFYTYHQEIDYFLSCQCNGDNKVTHRMLFHAILNSTNEMFPEMRLSDIYKKYRYLKNDIFKITKAGVFPKSFDKYVSEFFPCSRDNAIEKIMLNLYLSKQLAELLFDRWQYFYFIDFHPYKKWIPCHPQDTLTIEQFKEYMSIKDIVIKHDINTERLFFEAGNNIGKVLSNEMQKPKHPLISLFLTFNSRGQWLLHDEEDVPLQAMLADF